MKIKLQYFTVASAQFSQLLTQNAFLLEHHNIVYVYHSVLIIVAI